MQQMMMQQSAGGKKTREVYVGNLAIGMVTDQMLREFFNTALAGLSPDAATQPSVVNVWMAADMKYSFVELRTAELATISMGLDKVELCGRSIHCGRPGGYVPPDVSSPSPLCASESSLCCPSDRPFCVRLLAASNQWAWACQTWA